MRNPDRLRLAGKAIVLPALFAAMLAAAPVFTASAQGSQMSPHGAADAAAPETIEQRISSLHDSLKITSAEEADWKAVAQTMRDNADAMQKLASDKESRSASEMTAVDDLQTYSAFAQAHVDHLKKLTAAFTTLYNAMPAQQKKLADQVFSRAHRDESAAQNKQG